MVVERDSRRASHRDHAADRVRTRTPVIGVPVRIKAHTLTPPMGPSDEDLTPVDTILGHLAERGVIVTRDMRLAVEEILEHTQRVEQRTVRRASAEPSRWDRLVGVAKWLGPLLVALAGAIYAAGVRQGESDSAAAARAADRHQLEQVMGAVRQLELDVSNLRGSMRARGEDRTP